MPTDYDDPAIESSWLQEQRNHVLEYLANEEVSCDGLAKSPSWFVVPYVAIWSAVCRGSNEPQLWIISGDLPADYVQSNEVTDAREAMRAFALQWSELSLCMIRGERHPTAHVGYPENQQKLGNLLQKRSKILQRWANDDSLWINQEHPLNH